MKHVEKYIPDKSNFRTFQIGFNKCGTRTIFRFFNNNGIPSVHYDGGRIAGSMFRHFNRKEPLIDNRYKGIIYFGDMEIIHRNGKPLYVGPDLFRYLDREYPNSKFILNTRDRNQWIRSRIAHDDGEYLSICAKGIGLSDDKTVDHWKQEWDTFHSDVLAYFINRPNDLLVFDIDKDGHSPDKLIRFFRPYFNLSARHWHFKGKTNDTLYQKALVREQNLQSEGVGQEIMELLRNIITIKGRAEIISDKTRNDRSLVGNNYVASLQTVIKQLEIQLQNLTR